MIDSNDWEAGGAQQPEEETTRWTRDEDSRLLNSLRHAVDELDSLTERLKRVIEDHEAEDDINDSESGHA